MMLCKIVQCILTATLFLLLYAYIKVLYRCMIKVRVNKSDGKKSKKPHDNALQRNVDIHIEKLDQPPGPLPLPIIGNLLLIGRYAVPFQGFTELAKKYGDIYTLTLGSTKCLIVNNLNVIREVLNKNGKFFGGRPDFKRFHVLFGGDRSNSLALCDWSQLQQRRRNLARKHCSPRDASSFYQKMSDVGCSEMHEFIDRLSQIMIPGEDFEIKPVVQQTCANMFIQYMCSLRFSYDDKRFEKIVKCFDEIFWEINQGYAVDFLPWLSPFYGSHMKRIVYWSETIRTFILEHIIDKRENDLNLDEPERDFTDALLKSLVEDDVSRDTIIFMLEDFIGGHSAIGNLVMLALAYIVRNPIVGQKIQHEIDGIMDDTKCCVHLTDIEQMPYTVATIFEVLRYSSSPIVPHVATEDVAIAGYGITKGTLVFINNYELNTSEKYWTQPQEFNPDRFTERKPPTYSTSTSNKQLNQIQLRKNIPHFLPFSIGKRTCIGQNLVKAFSFIMLANIMHKYDVSCRNVENIRTYPACIAIPHHTFYLSLKPRVSKI
ncbi:cytochrome P450 307a1-like [Scaptodrosophila lebanonensis]|uniref:Cytochrome P450 307a1-like n=1 Tax=Drosophila lebanonensis TaxID=7225 RepID=A0A6J2T3X3_DROLE|nr:cytochrome P450 307a1-like [Scaptodrosophila lebanonensis]XP_030369934.1 cytochrome P450 307a1-like [Scaptodrosophila lebanonensis]